MSTQGSVSCFGSNPVPFFQFRRGKTTAFLRRLSFSYFWPTQPHLNRESQTRFHYSLPDNSSLDKPTLKKQARTKFEYHYLLY